MIKIYHFSSDEINNGVLPETEGHGKIGSVPDFLSAVQKGQAGARQVVPLPS